RGALRRSAHGCPTPLARLPGENVVRPPPVSRYRGCAPRPADRVLEAPSGRTVSLPRLVSAALSGPRQRAAVRLRALSADAVPGVGVRHDPLRMGPVRAPRPPLGRDPAVVRHAETRGSGAARPLGRLADAP